MSRIMRLMSIVPGALWFAVWSAEAPAQAPALDWSKEKVNEKDGAQMVWAPAGEFLMGSREEDAYRDEQPQRRVCLDGYWIYKHPVTVAQFRRFAAETGYNYNWSGARPVWGWVDNHPMVRVSWHEANAYAKWAGAALPTEAQWEKAARGIDGRRFPWGNEWDSARCNSDPRARRTSAVGSYPAGASPCGALDMAGNVWEWCADWYDADYYKNAPANNPPGPAKGETRILRGGGFNFVGWSGDGGGQFRCAGRGHGVPHLDWINWIGFRCVSPMPEQALDDLLAGFDKAEAEARRDLVRVLGAIGGPRALQTVRSALEDNDASVREAAVRALSKWPDPGPIDDLLALATDAGTSEQRHAALAGHARMIGMKTDLPPEQACEMFLAALDLAERAEEKAVVFAGLGNMPDPHALRSLEQAMEEMQMLGRDDALRFAEAAYIQAAELLVESHPKEAREALTRIAASSENKDLAERAAKAARAMPD